MLESAMDAVVAAWSNARESDDDDEQFLTRHDTAILTKLLHEYVTPALPLAGAGLCVTLSNWLPERTAAVHRAECGGNLHCIVLNAPYLTTLCNEGGAALVVGQCHVCTKFTDVVRRVLEHELVHAVVWPSRGHGPEFCQWAHALFGHESAEAHLLPMLYTSVQEHKDGIQLVARHNEQMTACVAS